MNKYYIIINIFLFVYLTINVHGESFKQVKNIKAPKSYTRIKYNKNSYSNWIKNLSLKNKNEIKLFTGKKLQNNYYNVFAVINKKLLFKKDVEQCADFAMRFWADYHKEKNKLNELYLFNYPGKKKFFRNSKKSFRKFLNYSMSYSNSYSLKKGCKIINVNDIKPGDMIVQNETGGIGHVSIVLDVCIKNNSEKLYLIGFSFMPAQEFHIEKADSRYGRGGWFSLEGYIRFLNNNYPYGKPVFRRFK